MATKPRASSNSSSRIPFGGTATYTEVASEVGRPQASRAAGNALGANPVPIVVPCHRVLGRDGALTGYAGGLERKSALLALESARDAQLKRGFQLMFAQGADAPR